MFTTGALCPHIRDPQLQGPCVSQERNILQYHLPEERGIPCHFLDVLAFLDRRLHSQVGVRLSEQENNIDKVNSPLGQTCYESVKWIYFKFKRPELNSAELSLPWVENMS